MKKALLWIFTTGLVITLTFLLVRRSDPYRKEVDYWVNGSAWLDAKLSPEENEEKRLTALRQLGPAAVNGLIEATRRRDSLYFEFYQRASPGLRDTLPRPKYTPLTRREAARVLGQLGPGAKVAAPDLLRLLQDNDAFVRYEAALAFGSIGDHSQATVSALTNLFKDSYALVGFAAALSVWRINRTDSYAAAVVESALTTKGPFGEVVVRLGSKALGSLGKEAVCFVPALAQGMTNATGVASKIFAAKALWRMQGSAAPALYVLDVITNALASAPPPSVPRDRQTRSMPDMDLCLAAQILMEIHDFRVAVRPHLCSLTNYPDRTVVATAWKHLDQIQQLGLGKGVDR